MNKLLSEDKRTADIIEEDFGDESQSIRKAKFTIKDGVITQCNQAFADIVGLPCQDIVDKKHIQDFIFIEDQPKCEKVVADLIISDKSSKEISLRIVRGDYTKIDASMFLTKEMVNEILVIEGAIERILSNPMYQLSLNAFKAVFNSSSNGLILTDSNGSIRLVNKTLCSLLKIDSNDFLQKNIHYFLKEFFVIDIENLPSEDRTNLDSYELICVDKEGKHSILDLKRELIHDENNAEAGELFILKDLSEKNRLAGDISRNGFRYENLFEKMSDPCILTKVITSPDNNVSDFILIEANHAFEQLTKIPNKKMIGKNIFKKIKYLQEIEPNPLKLLGTLILQGAEGRFEFNDRKTKNWYSVSIYTPENGFAFIIIHDITKEKLAQDEVNKSKQMLRTILDNIPQRVFWKDKNSKFLGCNIHFAKDVGINDPDKIEGKSEYDFALNAEADHYVRSDKSVIETGKPIYASDYQQYINQLNDKIWVRLNKVPLRNLENEIIGVIGTYEDISRQRSIEENLRILSEAVEQSPVSIVITDLSGAIEYVNQKFTAVTGYTLPEVIGKNSRILKSGEMTEKEYQELWNTITSGNVWMGEFHNRRKTGEMFWERAAISPIKDTNAKITHYLAVKEDITSYKRFEKDLRDAKDKAEEINRLKSIFLANISHELRTPLIGILGYAETLYSEIENPDFKDMAHTLLKSGTRLKETINLILDLSHIEADKIAINLSRQNLNKIVREKLKQFHLAAKEKGVRLKIIMGDEDLEINADERMLAQVIEHLLANAVKYTNKGEISISISESNSNSTRYAVLKIKDTGVGISRENTRLIFEPFRQASEGLSRAFEGLGLGLTVAKKFVELMDGEISVESAVGEGSEFTVKFPVYSTNYVPSPKDFAKGNIIANSSAPHYKFDSEVLLIEDDKPTADIIRFYLSETCKSDWAGNGIDAIAMAAKKKYAAILVDINLGRGMNGLETIQTILASGNYTEIPIIAVTAYALYGDREKFLSQGCTHYISKPFAKEDIVRLIEEVLVKSR